MCWIAIGSIAFLIYAEAEHTWPFGPKEIKEAFVDEVQAYHIDYTFVSRPEAIEAVTMGSHADWLAHSDHSPMTVDLWV